MIHPLSSNSWDPIQQFLELSREYQGYAKEAGIDLIPYRDQSLPLFSSLDEQTQRELLEALSVSVKICRDTKAQGHQMGDSPSLLWQALKQFGLRPPSDLFSHMNDCSVIELYSFKNIQLFRSFSFFRYCSYTLEELYCQDWMKLFSRDDTKVLEQILEFFSGVLSGAVTHTTSLRHIPNHIVREVSSPNRFVLDVGINWGAPLFLEGQSTPGAIIFLETGNLLDSSDYVERPNKRGDANLVLVV